MITSHPFHRETSVRHATRRESTRRFVIRLARRFAAASAGHAYVLCGEDESDWRSWVQAKGISWSGTAPRCHDHHGCFSYKMYDPGVAWSRRVSALDGAIRDAHADEDGESAYWLGQCLNHERACGRRHTHRSTR